MPNKSQSGTVAKALSLMFALAEAGSEGLSLGQIAAAGAITKPTAHRLLATLLAQGFAERVAGTRLYRLGPAAAAIARRGVALEHEDSKWRQGLVDIVRTTNDPSFLLARCSDDALCLDAFYGSFAVRTLTSGIGGRMPLGSGPGSIAILAALPDAEVEGIITRNRRRLAALGVNHEQTLLSVRETRLRGYCYDPGRLIPETAGLAITLPQSRNARPMALSVGTLTTRLQGSRVGSMIHVLRSVVTSAAPLRGGTI